MTQAYTRPGSTVVDFNANTGDNVAGAVKKNSDAVDSLFTQIADATTLTKGVVLLGTSAGTAAEGNHAHSGVYQPAGSYAPAAQGVTNGDAHDHGGGDGGQIAYASLSGLPTLGTAASLTAGTAANNVVQLDSNARLPAIDGRNLTNIASGDQLARDNAAMNAFISHLQAGRATGPAPGGGIWLFGSDELTKTGATYNSTAKAYGNTVTLGPDIVPTLAGPTSGTFTVSQTSIYGGSLYPGWKAFDGSTVANNSWISASTFPQTLTVDFGGVSYTIGGVTLRCDDEIARAPRDFTIQTYDGASWTTRYTATGVTWTANETKTLSLTPVSCKGLRIVVTAANGAPEAEINEMELLPLLSTAAMTLTTPAGIALGSVPTKATLYLLHKSVDALTYNTDIIVKASRGAGYAAATDLVALCQYDAQYTLLRATVDLSALASGATGLWRVETTSKSQQLGPVRAWFE